MKARRWERVGSLLGFLLLILSLLLGTLTDPVAGASSKQQRKSGEQQKRPISSASSSSSSSNGQKNSTLRNPRQVPEIPALYSAPKPEIPALYSAPEINQKRGQENEVDYDQMRATTEVTIIADDEGDSPEENSSVDYQYGVPTEKYGAPLGPEDEVVNDYPTDSPIPTSKANEVDKKSDDDETDSYARGYNKNRSKEPSPQYGVPQQPNSQYGVPQQPNSQYGAPQQPSPQYGPPSSSPSQQQQPPAPAPPKNGRGRENPKRKMYSTPNRRPTDQQQIENSLQPTTQMRPNQEGTGGPQPGYYLPPSKTEPQQQQQQQPGGDQRNEKKAYGADPNQHLPPKPTSYQAPQPQQKEQPQKNGGYGGEPQPTQQHRSSEGYPRSGSNPPQPSQQRSGIFPQQESQQQGQRELEQQKPSQQGQDFGRDASTSTSQRQPNSFYGPPGVNHFDSGSQDELEGLNEKIVDAELLQRVQQIIEDHERQQKVLLDNIQKDNEKAYSPSSSSSSSSSPPSSSGYPTASGPSTFTGNELNGPTDFSVPPAGGGYNSDFQSPNYSSYNSNGVATGDNNGGAGDTSSRSPNYFNSNNDVPSSSSNTNDYSNSNSYPSGGNSYNQPQQQPGGGYPQPSSARDNNNNNGGGGSPSSSYPGGYKSSEERQETQPDPQYSKPTGSSGGYQQQGDEQHKLNSVAGPGEEYLPPVPQSRQLEQQQPQQQYELQRNVQNVGYSNSFPADSQVQSSNTRTNGEDQGYSVKVGTGILVSDGGQPIPSYNYGSLPPQSPSFSSQQQNFPSRQDGSSAPGVFANVERFPSKPPQPQQQLFTSQPPPSPNPTFWSRGNLSPQPQVAYGAPLTGEVNNRSPTPISGVQEQSSLQIKYSNPGLSGDGGAQRPAYGQPQPQYSPSSSSTGSQPDPYNNNNQAQQPYNAGPTGVVDPNGNAVMIAIPRPIYGVPLAPVITLDSDNNLPTFNGSPSGNAGGEVSYSPDAIKTSTSNQFGLDHGLLGQGRFDQTSPQANYLPPSQYNGAPAPIGNENLSNSLHSPSDDASSQGSSYGVRDNNPSSSSSSAYLSIQGHGGNSNNHIYNINHNGYGSGISSSSIGIGSSLADADDSSIIIPGISNTFTLPVYDYSPTSPHHQNGDDELSAAASSSPVVVPIEHLLEQLQAASHNSQPNIFYGSRTGRQDNIRVLRRALSKTGNVSSAPPNNPNGEQLGTSRSSSNNNESKSSHPPSSSTLSNSKPNTNSHHPRRRT